MSQPQSNAPTVYVLTDITRKANQNRRVVIQGFDVRWRTVVILGATAVPAIVLGIIGWSLAQQFGLILPPLFIGGAFYLIEHRTRTGLQLPMYRTILDRRRSSIGKFFMCGREIDPAAMPAVTLMASTVPVHRDHEALAENAMGIDRP